MQKRNGSALVLTLMAVLILSGLAITGLTVSSTEIQSTHNFYLNKQAYYTAVEGVEQVRNLILQNPEPTEVIAISKTFNDTTSNENGIYKGYITGSMQDLRYYVDYGTDPPPVDSFEGFDPPPLTGIAMGSQVNISPVIWRVDITSRVTVGKRTSYSEIESGVYSIVMTGY